MPFVTTTRVGVKTIQAQQRQGILSRPLSATQSYLFHMSPDDWRAVDRSTLAGYRCIISPSVLLSQLTPLHTADPCLSRMSIHRGPVTQLAMDAIVNAANEVCLGGGGVDGAIHHAAGELLQRECATLPGCPTGECVLTKGYNLPARFVLHTVGPVGEKPDQLRSCYRSVLSLAMQNSLRSVGLCAVSTGVYGYPLRAATRIAVEEVTRTLRAHPDAFDMICFACFKEAEAQAVLDEITEQRVAHASLPGA